MNMCIGPCDSFHLFVPIVVPPLAPLEYGTWGWWDGSSYLLCPLGGTQNSRPVPLLVHVKANLQWWHFYLSLEISRLLLHKANDPSFQCLPLSPTHEEMPCCPWSVLGYAGKKWVIFVLIGCFFTPSTGPLPVLPADGADGRRRCSPHWKRSHSKNAMIMT